MADYQSSFDFVLSAGVDTSAIKQDILKAYKDVQVNINGQKLTISNIVIDSKDALDSFKKQMNNISLSNGIKIEIDTEAFKNAQVKITELQSSLDKTSLKTINSMFQKSNRNETFKSLIKDIQLSDDELEKLNTKAEELFKKFGKKKDQGNLTALKDYQEEYVMNQKLYQVMQQQIDSLKKIQSIDGWSNNIENLSETYKLLKSIESIHATLKNTKYSELFNIGIDNVSSLDSKGITEKYNSLANNIAAQIRGQEEILRTELNNLIESWSAGANQINNTPISPDIKTEGVKEKIEELRKYLETLQNALVVAANNISKAELSVDQNLPNAEGALDDARKEFDLLSKRIKNTTDEITNLQLKSSDFSGFSDKDLNNEIEKATKNVTALTRQIDNLDATRVDISGLSDDDVLNKIKEVHIALNNMLSGKKGAARTDIVNGSEFKNLLAQFKILYKYANDNKLDLSKTEISKNVLDARVQAASKIELFNEETYNSLVAQRNELQEIVDKCREELKLRQSINNERSESENVTTAVSGVDADTKDGNGHIKVEDGELSKKVKLVPDTSTFKVDADTELSKVELDKEVKLNPVFDSDSSSTINSESNSFDAVKQSVIDLTTAIDKKTNAITQEKIAMDVAAQGEAKSIQSIIDKIDELDRRIRELAELKISIVGVDNLDSIENLDLSKLQVPESSLDSLTNLSYVLETLKSLIIDIQNLNLSSAIGKDTLSGVKFTKENSQALESVAQNLPTVNNALTNIGSVAETVKAVEELTKKIAVLKGVVDNIKDIKVEIIENTTTGKKETKVNGKKGAGELQQQGVELSRVLQQTEDDYKAIAEAARKANPALGETVKVIQTLRLQDDGKYAQSFSVSDDKGNSAIVNKDGKYYLGHSVVKDDIAAAKQEQKELNDAVAEYKQHLKEIQALDSKNAKTKESNANYLLSEQLKSLEKIAKLKAEIITRESQGKDASVLKKKLLYEKQYCKSLAEEMEYYKGTQAYHERIAALRGKSKETALIVEDAKVLAQQRQEDKAWKQRLDKKRNIRKKREAEAKAELEVERQITKEIEQQEESQRKRGQAFLQEQLDYSKEQSKTDVLDRNKKANQELIDTIQQYGEVSKRIANNKAFEGDIELAEKLETKISELQKQPILSPSQIEASERKLVKLYDELDVIEKRVKKDNEANTSKLTEELEAQLAKETEQSNKNNQNKWAAFSKEQQDYLETTSKVNTAISETDTILNNLSLKRLTSEYSKLVTIQQNRDVEAYNKNAKAAEQEAKAAENQRIAAEKKRATEEKAAEAQRQNARKVADAQQKYEEDLLTKKQKANRDYINWWTNAYKETDTDYADLEKTLDKINALEIKQSDKGLTPIEQAELNDLLAQELKLREAIANHGIVDTEADERLTQKEAVLQQEKLSALYDQAIDKQEKIYALQVKQAKGKITTDEQTELNALLSQQKEREAEIEEYKKRGIQLDEKALALQKKKADLTTDLANITGGKVYESGDSQKNKYNQAQDVDANLYISSVSTKLKEAQVELKRLFDELNNGAKRSKDEVDKLNREFEEQLKLIKNLSNTDNLLNNNGLQYFGGNFTGSVQENKDDIISYLNTLDMGKVTFETFTRGHQSMIVSMRGSDNQIKKYEISLKDTTNAVYGLYKSEKAYTSLYSKWMSGLKSKFMSLTQYITGIEILMRTWTELQRGFQIVRELDTALTEMRKVSDETVDSLRNFQDVSFDIAESVGATAATIQNSTADFMRLGESLDDAAESAQVANILLNVSEFESIDEATESLVSMSQAYQDLEKIDIVDVLNNIGNKYSISTDGLATALQRSASALKTANNDLNEAVALTTAGNAIAQDPDSVGAGLRTISLRLVGTEAAKEELESLGEETDDVITTTSKLRDIILSATKAATADGKGFDILDPNGNYKSTYEIMQGLADLYDDIVAKDKELGTNNLNLLLETIAGKNRANIAASILQNGDMLRSVYEDAQDSDGSAQKELDKYLDSIEGKISKLTNSVQEFWHTFIDSDFIKTAIDFLSDVVQFGTKIVDTFGALPTVLMAVTGFFTAKKAFTGGGRARKSSYRSNFIIIGKLITPSTFN